MSISSILAVLCSCSTIEPVSPRLPSLSVIRPERPELSGGYDEMLRSLLIYTFTMEEYASTLEGYIEAVNESYSTGQVETE